jgi:hypothetical protein
MPVILKPGVGGRKGRPPCRRRPPQADWPRGNTREAAMADGRKRAAESLASKAELLRLQALADKRNQALDTASNAIRKQEEARRGIIDKMR